MPWLGAPLALVLARARRRPGRWLVPALGIALASAFAAIVAGEGTIAGAQASRATLNALSPLERTVRVIWQGPVTSTVERQAQMMLARLGMPSSTEVVLLDPVRLSGIVVRPAAITPLQPWIRPEPGAQTLGPCRPSDCPALLTGGVVPSGPLTAAGVRITAAGHVELRSAAPLGFVPGGPGLPTPLLLSGDARGLAGLAGLTGVNRSHQWFALLRTAQLHPWQLAGVERRLLKAQAALVSHSSQFTLTAPFAGLSRARAQVAAAPNRLLLAGGGALAALALFVVLAVGGLRRDVDAELRRLRAAGARSGQSGAFVIAEAALLSVVAIAFGAVLGIAGTALLAGNAGEPVAGVLGHSLLTGTGVLALLGGWLASTAVISVALSAGNTRLGDLLLVAATAALVLALALGSGTQGSVAVLLAPLCCLAAGVVVYRASGALLRAGERVARRGPILVRLSFVGLARAPGPASLSIAFVAVAIGLGGFALSYRATLLRGAADEAANGVPLDAIVAPGSDYTTPLQLASLPRWRSLVHGSVWPIRRTDAAYVTGPSAVTVPALGVPAGAIAHLRGWRESDGSAPLATLARRLVPPGPARTPGPMLPANAVTLAVRASAPVVTADVAAELRAADGTVTQLPLGEARARGSGRVLRARLPPHRGPLELEGLELTEPAGLEATNGHQDGENVAAATQAAGPVRLGPATVAPSGGAPVQLGLGDWTAVGAAARERGEGPAVTVRFSDTGEPAIVRPRQPSDGHPVPVLVDPGTAAAVGIGSRFAVTVDGLPVSARVAGVMRRFPTLPATAAGFVIADEATLAGALDGSLPGQGRSDELWISTRDPGALHAALRVGLLAHLVSTFRSDLLRRLRGAPTERAVLGTLIGATAVSAALALIGLLVALLGAARDPAVERDLVEQGVGPRELGHELRLRLVVSSAFGVVAGVALAVLLTRLAVSAVRAAGTLAVPRPPLVAVAPWALLALWGVGALVALLGLATAATRVIRSGTPR
jgi:hypothetical protein